MCLPHSWMSSEWPMHNGHANASTHGVSGYCLMSGVVLFGSMKARDWARLGCLVFDIR